nr:hypothetical protein [Tanacetum cinerariifolium]
MKLMKQMTSMCEMVDQLIQKKQEEKQIQEDQAANTRYWKIPAYYDDDDDEEESNSLKDNNISELPLCSAVTPNEPVNTLIMGDEHLDTVPATESDEFIKSSGENLVPNPSESKGENGCDPLHNEDFPEENFSNPLFEEEISSIKKNQHHFNAESDLIGSLLNHDSSIIPSSSKIDSLLDEFIGELTLLKSIPPGIDETDYHPENEIQIDLTFTPDDPMPPSIEEDDDDSRDTLIREELLDNYPFQSLRMSHFILIFLRFLVLLQNHQMAIHEF